MKLLLLSIFLLSSFVTVHAKDSQSKQIPLNISHSIAQQKKKISGKIVDENGIPMSGVFVFVKESTNGTTSNASGEYFLEISDKAKILVFSIVGMQTLEEKIGNRSTVNVTLKLAFQDLDEVMVIAYGTTTNEAFTGSAKMLNETKIRAVQNPDVTEVLQGNVSGVEISQSSGSPRESASIRIRGIGSINASSDPLIVVDGMPYGNSLNTINAIDIESVTVLKDAAATALYGSRAANGALLISTKKGKENKQRVEFSAQWGVSTRAIPDYETVNSKQYYELIWEGLFNAYSRNGEPNPAERASEKIVSNLVYNPFSIAEPVGTDGKIKSDAMLLWDADWSGSIYNTGKKQEYGLVFSGGNEVNQYYMSLGFLDFDGILANSKYKRYTARVDNRRKVFDWLNIGMNLAGSTTNSNEPIGEVGFNSLNYQASSVAPIYPIYLRDNNGIIFNDASGNPLFDYGMNGDEDGRAARPYWASPGVNNLGSEQYDKNTEVNDQLSMRTFAEFGLLNDLTFKSSLSFDYSGIGNHRYLNPEYGIGAFTNGQSTKSEFRQKVWTINNLLNYNKTLDKNTFSVLVGHERYKLYSSFLTATKTNFDFANMYELAAGSVISDANSNEDNYRLESLFSRLNYDYDNRYYVSASYRTDGSSRFSKDVRWGNFWSLGASWRISKEEFMENPQRWLSNLKIKASYGTVGNDNLGTYYAYQQLYSTGHNNLDKTGVQISRLGTPDLTWEVSKASNVGFEMGLFDRMNMEVEFFKRKVEDLLFARPLPLSAGITSVDENVGDMQNTGVEFNLFINAVKKNHFFWNIELNATHYKNKITRLVQDEIVVGKFIYKEGNSANDFYLKEWAGVDPENGDPLFYTESKDFDNRGTTNNWFSAPKFNQGTSLPKLFGGFTNTFNYKGIELQVLFNYKIGGTIYDNAYQLITQSGYYGGLNIHSDVLNRWTPTNKNTDIPSMNIFNYNGNITSSRYIMDASYIRLRNLSLSYNLPDKICNKVKMENCKISVIGQNLLTFSHSKGYDPEAGFTNEVNYNYPQLKVISLGLNITL